MARRKQTADPALPDLPPGLIDQLAAGANGHVAGQCPCDARRRCGPSMGVAYAARERWSASSQLVSDWDMSHSLAAGNNG